MRRIGIRRRGKRNERLRRSMKRNMMIRMRRGRKRSRMGRRRRTSSSRRKSKTRRWERSRGMRSWLNLPDSLLAVECSQPRRRQMENVAVPQGCLNHQNIWERPFSHRCEICRSAFPSDKSLVKFNSRLFFKSRPNLKTKLCCSPFI